MTLHALECPKCGGPLPAAVRRRVTVCSHCGASIFFDQEIVKAASFRRAYEQAVREESPLVRIGETAYNVVEQIARGESSDVMLARRAHVLSERVTLKMARASSESALRTEHAALAALGDSRTALHQAYSRLVPQIVQFGEASSETRTGLALATRYPSGFVHTLDDIRRAHPAGLDTRHTVWIWRRMLELLGWVHASGWTHGRIVSEHVLVHARDHGVRLVGWSHAARHEGNRRQVMHDVAMSARTIAQLLGSDVPSAFAALLGRQAEESSASDDAQALAVEVGEVAREIYGPPKFVELELPGWS